MLYKNRKLYTPVITFGYVGTTGEKHKTGENGKVTVNPQVQHLYTVRQNRVFKVFWVFYALHMLLYWVSEFLPQHPTVMRHIVVSIPTQCLINNNAFCKAHLSLNGVLNCRQEFLKIQGECTCQWNFSPIHAGGTRHLVLHACTWRCSIANDVDMTEIALVTNM